jgi:hypothetical protein
VFDRVRVAALETYSLAFVSLHAIAPITPITWAVDFMPDWGSLTMVAAYLATFVISIDHVASTIGRFVVKVTTRLPKAVWTIGWITIVFVLLWALRDHRHLGDGPLLMKMTSEGYRYDPHSLVGKFLQSIVFQIGQRGFGWTAEQTWALTSVLWGLAFIPAVTSTCRTIFGRDRMAVFALALIATQATSALYFGYIEDYVAASVLVLLYVRAAVRAMRGEGSVVLPGLLLGTTLLFSMAWAFLLPSLGWLAIEVSRGRRYARFLGAALACPALLIAVMAGFRFVLDVDVIDLYRRSHVAGLSLYSAVTNYASAGEQAADLIQLHLLVAPYSLLLVALLVLSSSARSVFREPIGRFLAVTAGCGLLMGIVWFPSLGMDRDWDLFALFGTPLSLFAAFLLARCSAEPQLRPPINRALLLTGIHTLFWIWTGHVAGPH